MGVLGDAADAGVDAGIARAERYGLRIEVPAERADAGENYPEELDVPLEFTRRIYESNEASARFCELFAEMIAVATVARHVYNDPALTETEMETYLHQSYSIFNSFRHA
jgi:hypothetical protein